MTTHSLLVPVLLQAHLTTIVQHHEGRAPLPRQQPLPTTATDPLPTRGVMEWRRDEREMKDSTSTADSQHAHPQMTLRTKVPSETSVKFECSLTDAVHSWPVEVPHRREDVVNYQSDVLVKTEIGNLQLPSEVWNGFYFSQTRRLRVLQKGFSWAVIETVLWYFG